MRVFGEEDGLVRFGCDSDQNVAAAQQVEINAVYFANALFFIFFAGGGCCWLAFV